MSRGCAVTTGTIAPRWPGPKRHRCRSAIGASIIALLSDPALPNVGHGDRKHGSGDPDHPRFHAGVHNQNHGLDAGTGGIAADDLRDRDRAPFLEGEALADPGLDRGRSFGAIGRASSCKRACGDHGRSVRYLAKCESARKSLFGADHGAAFYGRRRIFDSTASFWRAEK